MYKVGVFYDGNYFLHVSNYYNYFHSVGRRFCLPGFHRLLQGVVAKCEGLPESDVCVVTSHFFRGRLSAQEASDRGNQLYNDRVFDDILMSVGTQTHYLPLRNRMDRKEEKGIDVWLALEAYTEAVDLELDLLILVSSDGEYVPLIRKLVERGVKTMVLNWEFDYVDDAGREYATRTSHDLLQAVNFAVDIGSIIDEGLRNSDPLVEGLFIFSDEQCVGQTDERYGFDNSLSDDVDARMRSHGTLLDQSYVDGAEDSCEGGAYDELRPYAYREEEEDYDEIPEDSPRYKDRIMSVNLQKGFGFIRFPPNNLFFYYRDVLDNRFLDLRVGDMVEFSIGRGKQDREVAKAIRILPPEEEM